MIDMVIDTAALARLLQAIGGDVNDMRELVGDYEEDAPALVAAIAEAASVGDGDSMRVAAHSLKSNASDFGAARLSELCADLERDCREGGPLNATDAIEEIAAAEREARRVLGEVDLDALSP